MSVDAFPNRRREPLSYRLSMPLAVAMKRWVASIANLKIMGIRTMLLTKKNGVGDMSLAGLLFATLSLLVMNTAAVALSGEFSSPSAEPMATDKIEMQFRDDSLSAVAAELSRRSGVRIAVSSSIKSSLVNADVQAENWNDAIKSALAGFNFLAILDRDGRFQKIWLTGTKDPSSGSGSDATTRKKKVVNSVELKKPELKELPISLWQPVGGKAVNSPWGESAHAEPIQMDPKLFDSLEIGQPIEIPIPQEAAPVFGVIGENHSQLNGEVQVWSGPIDGSHETASFTVTRGEKGTYVTVATGTSIYEVSVDNATGAGAVVNETELTKNVTENDYIIPDGPQ